MIRVDKCVELHGNLTPLFSMLAKKKGKEKCMSVLVEEIRLWTDRK